MSGRSTSGCSVNKLLSFIQGLFRPQDGDGALMFWAKEILAALLIVSAFWLLAGLVTSILNKWGTRLACFTETDLDDRILQRLIPHVSRLLTILGFYLAIRSLPLHEKTVLVVTGVLYVILVAFIFNLIYQGLDELLKWYVDGRQDASDSAVMSRQIVPVAEKIFSLVTALGIGSLAIGMAAKDTMAHMISGFTLMLDRPFRIGDRIQLAGGQVGDVLDIGLRSTKIKTLDNQQLIIPNSDLCNTILTNQAFPDPRAKGRINVGVAYGSDVELVKEILVATALEVDAVLRDPAPEAFFVAFGESALAMSLFFWVDEYANLFAINDKINTRIIQRFRENNIEIPYPTRTVIMERGLE
jgi:MscS family membrane protein